MRWAVVLGGESWGEGRVSPLSSSNNNKIEFSLQIIYMNGMHRVTPISLLVTYIHVSLYLPSSDLFLYSGLF